MPLKKFKANIFPHIKEISPKLRKDLLTTAMAGDLASRLKGRGIEFEDYRDYTQQDDAERIDWRASQKSQRLLVREYKLDVNFNVFFLIDVSETMLFSSSKKLKCEYAAEVVTSLFYGLLNSGNSTGFALFSEGVVKLLKPKLGKKQFHLFSKEIQNPEIYGGKKDFKKAMHQAMSILDRKTLVFIVSDFIGVEQDLGDYLKVLSHVHEVVGIMIRDPRDFTLPDGSGQLLLEDPFSKEILYVDSGQYAKLYQDYNNSQLGLLRVVFHKNKALFLEMDTSKPYFNPLLKFLSKVGARWR